MSFTIYWERLDKKVAQTVQTQMNKFFSTLESRPEMLGDIQIEELDFGSEPPTIEILDITEPFAEFYLATDTEEEDNDDDEDYLGVDDDLSSVLSNRATPSIATRQFTPIVFRSGAMTPISGIWQQGAQVGAQAAARETTVARGEDDMQALVRIEYGGDMHLRIGTEMRLNYPTAQFASLPVTFVVSRVEFAAVAVVAYLSDRINFCFLESEDGGSLIRDFVVRTEVGDLEGHVLKNVERLEAFVAKVLRDAVDEEFVFPCYHSFELV